MTYKSPDTYHDRVFDSILESVSFCVVIWVYCICIVYSLLTVSSLIIYISEWFTFQFLYLIATSQRTKVSYCAPYEEHPYFHSCFFQWPHFPTFTTMRQHKRNPCSTAMTQPGFKVQWDWSLTTWCLMSY